jgi:hypothetical protein
MICFCFCFCALHMRSTTLLLDTKFDMFALLHMYIHISTISKEAIRLSDPPPLFLFFFFFFFFFFSQRHTRAHMTEQLHSSWVLTTGSVLKRNTSYAVDAPSPSRSGHWCVTVHRHTNYGKGDSAVECLSPPPSLPFSPPLIHHRQISGNFALSSSLFSPSCCRVSQGSHTGDYSHGIGQAIELGG